MKRRGVVFTGIGLAALGFLAGAFLAVDTNQRNDVLVDRAAQVARNEVADATEPGGALDDAVQAEVEQQVDDALATTTTASPITTVVVPPTTTTTTTTTQPPLLPAVTTTTVTIPVTLPTTLPTLPEVIP